MIPHPSGLGSARLSSARLGKRLLHHGNILINFSADSPVCLGENVSFFIDVLTTPKYPGRVREVLVVLTAGKCHLCGPSGRGYLGFFCCCFLNFLSVFSGTSSINPQ